MRGNFLESYLSEYIAMGIVATPILSWNVGNEMIATDIVQGLQTVDAKFIPLSRCKTMSSRRQKGAIQKGMRHYCILIFEAGKA